ncbi:hypothetical protein [Streptomyces sp. 6N223]|uniref:hypothetical protein n=1 Tax=Streptomyces sp. 6N223 TaxID=3457412 RepID=UPI003FD6427C
MTTTEIVFANQAADKIRSIPLGERHKWLDRLVEELSKRPETSEYSVAVPGTDYVAVHLGDRVTLARPMTESERKKFASGSDEAYFVADVIPTEEKLGRML